MNDYWNMNTKIPSVIVYACSGDQAFNEDNGFIMSFDSEEEFEEWKNDFLSIQVDTGCDIYAVFRRK